MVQDSNISAAHLFDSAGNLRTNYFDEGARSLLEDSLRWIGGLERSTLLPVDFVVTLLRRGAPDMEAILAQVIGIPRDASTLLRDLEAFARRVERPVTGKPSLHVDSFSLGSIGILQDGLSWAMEVGRDAASEADIMRAVRWRIEYQESASIRWVLKQLGQHASEQIFDEDGTLLNTAFSSRFWRALTRSAELSAEAGLPFVGTPQLIASLCSTPRSVLARTASDAGIRPERLRGELLRIVGNRSPAQPIFTLTQKTLTPRVIRMLEGAAENARQNRRTADDVDVLAEFLKDGGSSLELIRALGIEENLRFRIERKQEGHQTARTVPTIAARTFAADSADVRSDDREGEGTLDAIGRDLTALARAGSLPAVIGRDKELQQVLRILLRTEQRNPLLTGEPGVGKTAIAMALAQRIADHDVPAPLDRSRVIEINSAALLGGTSYRGELESRITELLTEAEETNAILFIDEAHAIFAPTSGTGRPAETPNHFKTALASGRIAVVAATTSSEYRRWIEQDPALKRRFEQIPVDELPPETTRQLLASLANEYRLRWGVEMSDECIDDVIAFSNRFIPQRSQPDKAKKLLMDSAIDIRLRASEQESPDDALQPTPMTREDIARVVHRKTRIPVERILENPLLWWRTLARRLGQRLPDQRSAAHELARSLFQRRFMPHAGERPYGALALIAPPGVDGYGFAESLALECFGSAEALTSIDMGDLADAHSMTRLFGAPPGYVGYSDEDLLITPLRQRPAQVVFFADFDSAHPRVQQRLIRMMTDARARDSRGYEADLRHAFFIFELRYFSDAPSIGFGQTAGHNANHKHGDLLRQMGELGIATVRLHNPAREVDSRQLHVARTLERFIEQAGISTRAEIDELQARGRALARNLPDHITLNELDARLFAEIIQPVATQMFDNSPEQRARKRARADSSSL